MTGILDLPIADVLIYLAETYAIEEDFESYNDTGWTESTNGDGALTVPSAAAAKRQDYGMRSEISGTAGRNSASIYKTFTNTDNDPVYTNFWFRINSTDLDEDDLLILLWGTSGLGVVGYLEIVESGSDKYFRIIDGDGNTYDGSAYPLTTGTWYHIRAALKSHSGAAVVYLEVNGTEVINETPSLGFDYTIASIFVGIDNLYMTGSYSMQGDFDEVYVALSQISVNIEPDDEAILNMALHLGCTNEVSSFEIMIDRGNPTYDQAMDPGEANALSTGLECDIYLGRGSNKPLLLTGQIDEIEYIDEVVDYSFRNVVIIRGRCKGHQLFGKHVDGDLIDLTNATDYPQLNYNRIDGDASSILAYVIDNYTSLEHVRVNDAMGQNANSGQKNVTVTDGTKFTEQQLVKIEDDNGWEYNRIDSISTNILTMYSNLTRNYTTAASGKVWIDLIENTGESDAVAPTTFTELIYDNTLVFDVLKFIAEIVDLDAVIGYDFRIEYDGRFAFFSKNSKSESYTLQDECQVNRYIKDATRIKNAITVFGKAEKPHPLSASDQPFGDVTPYGDTWTEINSQNLAQLASDAASGQADVDVAAGKGSQYAQGDHVWIIDANSANYGEELIVDSVATDTITMTTNLTNAYTTANHAIIFQIGDSKGWGSIPSGAWDDINVGLDATVYHTGSKCIDVTLNNALTTFWALFVLPSGSEFSVDDYNIFRAVMYFTTTAPDFIQLKLWSGTCTSTEYAIYGGDIQLQPNQWQEVEINGGSKNKGNWYVTASFDWTDVKIIGLYFNYASAGAGTYTLNVDRMHFFGKRWGGGTDDATVDGYAENTTSQITYGTRELIIINELLLSDTECENKAQALIDFYSSERLVIEVESDNLDWSTYHPMAGNKVAADLDLVGVTGSSYRIDSIDIIYRGTDNSLSVLFNLDNTPLKLADYLYKISEKLRLLERKYDTIR